MVCFKSIMKSKLQVCLAFKTRSPSKLRWRLRVEVTNTCRFEAEDLILRCSGDPRALVPSLRKVIASIDPDVAMRSTATYSELIDSRVDRAKTELHPGRPVFRRSPVLIGDRIGSSSDYFARQILYGVACNDASTFGLTVLVLVVSALIACWIPARRAASIDPIVALRQ
jgi:hypothetical protein